LESKWQSLGKWHGIGVIEGKRVELSYKDPSLRVKLLDFLRGQRFIGSDLTI